jgi:hypothetical protein
MVWSNQGKNPNGDVTLVQPNQVRGIIEDQSVLSPSPSRTRRETKGKSFDRGITAIIRQYTENQLNSTHQLQHNFHS